MLAHEAHHARRRDPLRQALLTVLADSLFFPSVLAAALLRFDDGAKPGAVGVAAERVDHLLGSPPRWRLPVSMLAAPFMTVGGLLAMILLAGSAASAPTTLGALAAQACMITMGLAPILVLVSLATVGRRMLSVSR